MKLFYSYSRKDEEYRDELEKHLSVLRNNGLVEFWHDGRILAGQEFQGEIDQNLKDSDLIVFLVSSDFLSSKACKDEMEFALNESSKRDITLIPIIVRQCDWKSSSLGDLQALPKDLKAISDWSDRDAAFLNVVEGITEVAIKMQKFEIRSAFKAKISDLEFVSEKKEDIQLEDIFVFPNIVKRESDTETLIPDFSSIWELGKHCILRGDERSGKTIVCRKMFLDRIVDNKPTLLLPGGEIRNYGHENAIERKFKEEFAGNYKIWKDRKEKMIIIDDFDIRTNSEFIDFVKELFDYIFLTISDDQYTAFYRDQPFLSGFYTLSIRPLRHAQQEELIRKWKALGVDSENQVTVTDNTIDRLENTVNAIVFRNRIVPRFPFYVLSILQTFEAFMPRDLQLTAYGHCYHVLIVAQLMRAGIKADDLDSAINYLSFFAFDLYQNRKRPYGHSEFRKFQETYRNQFFIQDDTIAKLTSDYKPIILSGGNEVYKFRHPFAYYYLVGYYLARNKDKCKEYIEELARNSYFRDNTFILIFTIHHSHDDDLIDDILLHTMMALGDNEVAKLDREETKSLEMTLRDVPEKILEQKSVREARREERDLRDLSEEIREEQESRYSDYEDENDDFYRALKNIEILGQILTNKCGSLPKERIKEIVCTVNDVGLRLVHSFTSEKTLLEFENFVVNTMKDLGFNRDEKDDEKLNNLIMSFRVVVLFVVLVLIRKTAASIGGFRVSEIVREVTDEQGTTGYKLIDLFSAIRSVPVLDQGIVERIVRFLQDCSKDGNEVVRRIVSLEVQSYCNTHEVDYRLRQKLFAELGLRYRPNRSRRK